MASASRPQDELSRKDQPRSSVPVIIPFSDVYLDLEEAEGRALFRQIRSFDDQVKVARGFSNSLKGENSYPEST